MSRRAAPVIDLAAVRTPPRPAAFSARWKRKITTALWLSGAAIAIASVALLLSVRP